MWLALLLTWSQNRNLTIPKYIPTDDDVLRARLKTLGVVEHSFVIKAGGPTGKKEVEWRIYDVGGARTQRQAWASYFDDGVFPSPVRAKLEAGVLLAYHMVSNGER